MARQYPMLAIEHPVNHNGYEGPPTALLLDRLEALAEHLNKTITVTSGFRSDAKQRDTCATGVKPCAAPGTSSHRYGIAGDAMVGGAAIQDAVSASTLRQFGLWPLGGDPPHVELAGAHGERLRDDLPDSILNRLYAAQAHGVTIGHNSSLLEKLAPFIAGGPFGLAAGVGVAAADAIPDPSQIAAGLVQGLFGEIAPTGGRMLLYIALIGGGATLIALGAARAAGVRAPTPQQAAQVAKLAAL